MIHPSLCLSQRLRNTNAAVVALGDDDQNIEVAVYLRSLFDRIHGLKAKSQIAWAAEPVDIYAVVYDEQKSGILHRGVENMSDPNFLTNHKNVPYHIRFIGQMSTQFHYDNIYDAALERKAYEHHSGWVDVEARIYQEWLKVKDRDDVERHEWSFFDEQTDEAAQKAREKYEKYEYYGLSSMAKELYQGEIRGNAILAEDRMLCLLKDRVRAAYFAVATYRVREI